MRKLRLIEFKELAQGQEANKEQTQHLNLWTPSLYVVFCSPHSPFSGQTSFRWWVCRFSYSHEADFKGFYGVPKGHALYSARCERLSFLWVSIPYEDGQSCLWTRSIIILFLVLHVYCFLWSILVIYPCTQCDMCVYGGAGALAPQVLFPSLLCIYKL